MADLWETARTREKKLRGVLIWLIIAQFFNWRMVSGAQAAGSAIRSEDQQMKPNIHPKYEEVTV
ncbi:MAG: hypothetical protein ACI4NA_05570, partial [Succinivibrio sp.]